jgi:hypothetical protein
MQNISCKDFYLIPLNPQKKGNEMKWKTETHIIPREIDIIHLAKVTCFFLLKMKGFWNIPLEAFHILTYK